MTGELNVYSLEIDVDGVRGILGLGDSSKAILVPTHVYTPKIKRQWNVRMCEFQTKNLGWCMASLVARGNQRMEIPLQNFGPAPAMMNLR